MSTNIGKLTVSQHEYQYREISIVSQYEYQYWKINTVTT